MSEVDLEPREAMDYDVVIVGGGPSGLAAAIRLKQIDPELSVVVVEKGSEIGAHILSGAVIDPTGLDELLPGWREDSACPLEGQGDGGPLLFPRAVGRRAAAQFRHAAADEQSRQFRRLARQCLPLPRRQGRRARRRDLSGLCRRGSALRRQGRGARHRHRRHGRGPRRQAQGLLHPRHGAARQIHLVRRGRARLAVQAADRQISASTPAASRRNTASA